MVLRIAGPEDLYEEARAAGMAFWEQLETYAVRNPLFQRSKRPIYVTQDAPESVQRMAELAMRAGVGPMFTFRGALTEHVGRALARTLSEVLVSCGPDHFVITRKRARLLVHRRPEDGSHEGLSVIVKPELGPHGIYTSLAGERGLGQPDEGVAIVASSCMLADAAAAGVSAILNRPRSLRIALAYLQQLEGVFGAVIIQGERIGVAGGLELAA